MGRDQNVVTAAALEEAPVPPVRTTVAKRLVGYIESIGERSGLALLLHIWMLALLAWIPSVALAYLLHVVFPEQKNPDLFLDHWRTILGVVVVSPLVETLGMRYLFSLLRRITSTSVVLSILSALIWGAVHFQFIGGGIHAIWPFFLLSLCYLRLESISRSRAILTTALIHGICNALSYGLYLLLERITN